MTEEEIEKALMCCACMTKHGCADCPEYRNKNEVHSCTIYVSRGALDRINRLKSEKQLAETQLKEILSALYQRADNKDKSFTVCRTDVVELARECGIKEEELK